MAPKYYNVYIDKECSPNQDEKLILVQFPALKSQFDNDVDRLNLSVKPKFMKLKLEVELNCHAKEFSSRRSQLLAEKSKPQIFPNHKVDKNIYTSSKNDVEDSQLFVCKLVDEKLICYPVTNVVSLRSDLTHFDLKEEVDPKEEVRPVSVKFAATDRQNAPVRPKETPEFEESLEDYRPYCFKDSNSVEAKSQREALFGISSNNVRIKRDPDAVPQPSDEKPVTIKQESDVKPKIEKMDLYELYSCDMKSQPGSPKKANLMRTRVKECLVRAKLVSFEEVHNYLREYRDISNHKLHGHQMAIHVKEIVDALNEHAVLVQGNWAVKSETLYGDSTVREATDVTGIPINLFTAARDYLLWLFNQDRLVSRPLYTKQVRIPDHDALDLFNQLATFRKDLRKWEFKLPTDDGFLEKFPEIVQRQNTFWKVRKANKLNIFSK